MVHTEHNQKKIRVEWVVFFLLLSVFFILIFIFFTTKKKSVVKVPSAPSQSTNSLPSGAHYFNVSYGDEVNEKPKMSYIHVDPLDVSPGTQQTISIKATSPYPIVQIASVLLSDKNKNTLAFSLTQGTQTDGVWSATWTVNDTVLKRYKIMFHLVNKADVRDDEITFR